MQEIWKNIKDYENLYQVSSLGRVKSLERITIQGKLMKEKLLTPSDNGNKYLYISLYKEGKRKAIGVHRLVAQAFIPNPNNLPQVNHLDEDTFNNTAKNLMWVTGKDNSNYGNHNKNLAKAQKRNTVVSMNMSSHLFRIFSSLREAERVTGVNHSNIKKVLDKEYKQCNGFIFFEETLKEGDTKDE